ncbi:ABC-2 type transport system permease protein [Amycolatopsis marina]|uniref:ABC-2 type transport system permease protein n=1 Tax=Amycolatopsis marina TaxID=490629 RepID=A0A1I0VVZ8_9PSEU|nr:hypothetical protein [Amycolatopsis marina]SFA79866.1 ABC-2 type transport system permease protein [Amycolatopsis marina]
MTLLRVERIKLFSTRAPWWCSAIAVASSLGFAALFVGLAGDQINLTVSTSQTGTAFGRVVILVLAVIAAASEYNWGTIRTTFQAVPKRAPALLAKAVVVGGWCALLGLLIGFVSWAMAVAIRPEADLALDSAADWRAVAGQAAVYLMTAAAGVGLGLLLRSTALALGVALVWTQLVEGLVVLIPGVGDDIYQWMPFFAADQFIGAEFTRSALGLGDMPMGPVAYGGYFAAICLALLAAGVAAATKKDA